MRGSEFAELKAFAAIVERTSFSRAADHLGLSASAVSQTIRQLEARLGVRLLNRTTRSVAPTEAGSRLYDRIAPMMQEMDAAVAEAVAATGRTAGTLRINTLGMAARKLIAPRLGRFNREHPDVVLDIVIDDGIRDIVAGRFDAGIRIGERLEKDMIAVPIGPRVQRFATAASPAYLDRCGRPQHPRDLLNHACLLGRFASGAMTAWEFECDGEVVRVDPSGPLLVQVGAATDLAVDAAIAGTGIIYLFEDWLRPHLDGATLEPVLERWWQRFSGPFLYYPGRRLLPAPLRAFVDFIKSPVYSSPTHGGHSQRVGPR